MSEEFWKLISWYEHHPDCEVHLAVNTNLGLRRDKLKRLVDSSKFISNFSLFTSNESYGEHAEYIRDGLKWDEWYSNLEFIIKEGSFRDVHVMLTINALSLASLDTFHEVILSLREKYNVFIGMSYNILRFPSFQSLVALPKFLRNERAEHYESWLSNHRSRLYDHEIDGMERTIQYIGEVDEVHSVKQLSDLEIRQNDFYNFYDQYDTRRNKSFVDSFKNWPEMVKWFLTLKDNSN